MKKLFALLLAVVMMMSLATVAFAEEPSYTQGGVTYTDMGTVTITKAYNNIHGGIPGVSPAETFAFEQIRKSVANAAVGITNENMPDIVSIGTAVYALGDAGKVTGYDFANNRADGPMFKEITITLPQYAGVGVYTYVIKEKAENTAGVTYFDDEMEVVVTVVQDSDNGRLRIASVHCEADGANEKTDIFINEYRSGDLTINKQVTGNLGDRTKDFEVVVEFTAPEGKTPNAPIYVEGAETEITWAEGKATHTFNLKHDATLKFYNIPVDTTYVVYEKSYADEEYKVPTADNTDETPVEDPALPKDDATDVVDVKLADSKEGYYEIATGKIYYGEGDYTDTDKVVITNEKSSDIDTGILMDSAPYVVMLLVAAAGLVLFTNKRRVQD